jgi:diadenosine tetraphosphate (Ap4A) HIT family hydrolase
MFVLRCTRRLLGRIKADPVDNPPVTTTTLGDWYANLVHIGRLQMVLAVSERTLLPVVVAAAPIASLPSRLRSGVADVLAALDIPAPEIDKEVAAMTDFAWGKTANRQVTGMMVDFQKAMSFYVEDRPELQDLSLRLAETPSSPLFATTVSPDRTTVALFGSGQLPRSRPRRVVEGLRSGAGTAPERDAAPPCVFCALPVDRIVQQDRLCVTLRDAFPVSPGHLLVVPRRHVASFFDLNREEQASLLAAARGAKRALDLELHPDGYNVGANIGAAAGQTVMHAHLHVIPRFAGDVPDPRGGIRHCIPGKGYYEPKT